MINPSIDAYDRYLNRLQAMCDANPLVDLAATALTLDCMNRFCLMDQYQTIADRLAINEAFYFRVLTPAGTIFHQRRDPKAMDHYYVRTVSILIVKEDRHSLIRSQLVDIPLSPDEENDVIIAMADGWD